MWGSLIAAFWGLFATMVVAGLTAWFQQRSWRKQDEVRSQEKAKEGALGVVHELSELLAKRIFRQKRYLWYLKDKRNGKENDEEEYLKILFEWNDKLGAIKTKLMFYFGTYTMWYFEESFHDTLATCHETLRRIKVGNVSVREIQEVQKSLDKLGRRATLFCEELLTRIKDLELEGYEGRDVVNYGNRKNLSVMFLLCRLLGLSR